MHYSDRVSRPADEFGSYTGVGMDVVTSQPTLARAGAGRPLREDVHQYLRDAILHGDLKPGDQIVETHLARQFGISQGPVREALRELEQIGLIEHHPHRGTFVRLITAAGAWEVYTLRAHLEVLAARLAVACLTDDDLGCMDRLIDEMGDAGRRGDAKAFTLCDVRFHELLCERAGHELLLRTWRGINPLSWTLFTLTMLRHRDLVEIAERHRVIVAALRTRDTGAAEAAVQDHVLTLSEEVRRGLPG